MDTESELKILRELWFAGLASGSGRFNSMDEIKVEARRQFDLRNYKS